MKSNFPCPKFPDRPVDACLTSSFATGASTTSDNLEPPRTTSDNLGDLLQALLGTSAISLVAAFPFVADYFAAVVAVWSGHGT